MNFQVLKTGLSEIQTLREEFLGERKFQFVHDKCHYYGWSDDYVILMDGKKIGYGCVWGENRDCVFEFYLPNSFRHVADEAFQELIRVSGVTVLECQTNIPLISSMVFRYGKDLNAEAILFEDDVQTNLRVAGVVFNERIVEEYNPNDTPFQLDQNGEVVATGGLMLNYNFPYADIYMEVVEAHRGKGYGSLIVQELKKAAYDMGRVPAARCNINNVISRKTLVKAGLRECGFLMKGSLK